MPTPHKHAEVIKAWADGQEIEYCQGGKWFESLVPTWREEREYRIKPKPAAPKWPQTTMTDEEIMIAMDYSSKSNGGPWRAIANQAIVHECSTGALVPADKVREIEAKARAEGAKSSLDPIDVIEATWRHLKSFPVSREDIQIILLKAAK